MCKWGTDTIIGVIRRNNEFIRDGWHMMGVDSCLAERVQLMNFQGIVTVGCCCGHGNAGGEILVAPESVPLLEKYGYAYVWPKDDPDNADDPWWLARDDIVIIKLPQAEKTWEDEVQS
jgi:hypothetical protein